MDPDWHLDQINCGRGAGSIFCTVPSALAMTLGYKPLSIVVVSKKHFDFT
jgi:hypothetical protein